MKRILLAAMASSLAIAAAAPAGAAIIIGIGYNNGAITQVGIDGNSGSASYVGVANGIFSNAGAVGFPLFGQPNLLTQSLNVQQAGNAGTTLNLYITETDLNAYSGSLLSSFTSNTMTNATAVLRSYFSTSNALFGGTQLASASFTAPGVATFTNALTAPGTFSTTVRYDITFGAGGGNFNGTANLAAGAVPEPATWGMMLFGFGGFGYAMRRRQKVGARIRFA